MRLRRVKCKVSVPHRLHVPCRADLTDSNPSSIYPFPFIYFNRKYFLQTQQLRVYRRNKTRVSSPILAIHGVGKTDSRVFGVDLNTFNDRLLRFVGWRSAKRVLPRFSLCEPKISPRFSDVNVCSWTGEVNGFPFGRGVQGDFYSSLLLSVRCLMSVRPQ